MRAPELVGIASFAGALAGTLAALPLLGAAAAGALRAALAGTSQPALVPVVAVVAPALLPAAGAVAAGTLAALAISGGFRIAPLRLAFEKLAPLPGLRRLFGGEALSAAVRASGAFVAVAAVVTPIVAQTVVAVTTVGTPRAIAHVALDAALHAAFAACAAGACFALADYALARRRWLRGLRMTLEELKREQKEQDGDPNAKQHRRRLHRALARGGLQRTREASFVVVNPTHVAIALRYAPPAVAVPEVLVRAADEGARTVRAIAERERIPVVEDAPLARWLYRSAEAGQPIPAATFVAVAETVAALIRAGLLAA